MRRTLKIVVAWALVLCAVCQGQTTWWVDVAASGPGNGSPSSPFASIAAGIAAASPGDRVNVGPGTYSEFDLRFMGKDIAVVGTSGAAMTTLDCNYLGRGFIFDSGESSSAEVQGLTINHAVAESPSAPTVGAEHGGGMLIMGASPTIRECVIMNCSSSDGASGISIPTNAGGDGGGVAILGGEPSFIDCRFLSNGAGSGGFDIAIGLLTGPAGKGGAVYGHGASPSFQDCTFDQNQAGMGRPVGGAGGALYGESGTWTLVRCTLTNNSAGHGAPDGTYGSGGGSGGGAYFSDCEVLIEDSLIDGNMGGQAGAGRDVGQSGGGGGGITFIRSAATVRNTAVTNNASGLSQAGLYTGIEGSGAGGGGIVASLTNLSIESSAITGNQAASGNGMYAVGGSGGGMAIGGGEVVIRSTIISGNSAGFDEFGMRAEGGGVRATSVRLVNCTLARNLGADSSGALKVSSSSTAVNCIFWDNGLTEINGPLAASFSVVAGGYPGTGNLAADPQFADPAQGDFHLLHSSPCIDAGDSLAAGLPPFDFDNDPRTFDRAVDIGADEAGLFLTLSQPGGAGTGLVITNHRLIVGAETLNVFSASPCPQGPGMGPSALLGLCLPGPADIQLALNQVTAPIGTAPFHFTAGASSMTFGPYSAAPLTVEGVCFQLSSAGVIEAASRVTRYSVQ